MVPAPPVCADEARGQPFTTIDGVALDPGEGPRHGPVVGGDDPIVSSHQRHERHRLGSRKGDVTTRPVLDLPVFVPLAEVRAVRHPAFEHHLEGVGVDRTREPQLLGPLPAQALASLCTGSSLA